MKKSFWIYFVILILVVLIVLVWLSSQIEQNKIDSQAQRQGVQSSSILAIVSKSNTAPIVAPPATTQNPILNDREKTNAIRQYMESQNKPIEFYCEIIDQDGNPISGVKLKIEVHHLKIIVPVAWGDEEQSIPIEKESGIDGRIEIHEATGDGFQVESVGKTGYQLSPQTPNHFGPVSGSFENPVIIKMWKIGERAQLISGNKFWGIIPDDRTYTMDFLKQTKLEGNNASGDIRVRIIRPAQIKPREKFDWSFEIEGIQGGVIQNQDEFMYLAPETGYQKYEFSMSTNNPNWKREMDGMQFYFQSRNGNVYGQFVVDVIPDYNEQSIFNVKFSVNPNGSRNLQP